MLRFVAIVDRDNRPVYFQAAPGTPDRVALNAQFIAEMSLDFVAEQMAQLQAHLHRPQLLVVHDGIVVYASLSNTRTVYLLGLTSSAEPQHVDEAMRALAAAHTGYQCSPFGSKDGPIESKKFAKEIGELLTSYKPAERETAVN